MANGCSIGTARVQATQTFDELLLLNCAAVRLFITVLSYLGVCWGYEQFANAAPCQHVSRQEALKVQEMHYGWCNASIP